MSVDPFCHRLEQCLDALPEQWWASLQGQSLAPGEQVVGKQRLLAARLGISESQLSRLKSGQRQLPEQRLALANLLQVPADWLLGENDDAQPDFLRSPVDVYRDFSLWLQGAWAAFRRRQRESVFPSQAALESGPGPLLDDSDTSPRDVEWLARQLGMHRSSDEVVAFIKGRWHRLAIEQLQTVAGALGYTPGPWWAAVARGHAIECEYRSARRAIQRQAREDAGRRCLPPHLFQLARVALVGLKQQRAYLDQDQQALDDCIELLWQQQLHRLGRDDEAVPAAFQEETGRSAFTAPEVIAARYAYDDCEPEARYRSRPPLAD